MSQVFDVVIYHYYHSTQVKDVKFLFIEAFNNFICIIVVNRTTLSVTCLLLSSFFHVETIRVLKRERPLKENLFYLRVFKKTKWLMQRLLDDSYFC